MNGRFIVAVAGATGDLGSRIAKAMLASGAEVRALVRPDASVDEVMRLEAMGAGVRKASPTDTEALAEACRSADCVVSALNGLHDVIVDRQSVLLEAAVKAGVPRFISSDYSADFTQTTPGENRNLDLRREFMAHADRMPIKVTSILNGAFLDMLGAEMPIIQPRIHRVLHWGDANQLLDFTTKDDVAAFVAAAAIDPNTPRILRIAGDTLSARDIAARMTETTGERYRTLRVGGIGSLGVLIGLTKLVAPQPRVAFPPWQGMQYMRDMFSGRGKLNPLDNDRYPALRWTSALAHLSRLQNHG
jgi:nucleoside-diphosphate-sugar epimerase